MKYVVIGNSAAGINAVETLRRLQPDASITLVSEEKAPIYSRSLLSYYLAGQFARAKLLYRPDNFYQKLDVFAHIGVRATKIDAYEKVVQLSHGDQIPYDALLLATGARSKMPDIPGITLPGVHPLRDLSDTLAIESRAQPDQTAVILGGGLVGLKAAQALKQRGLHVIVVVKSGRLLSQMLDTKASEIFKSVLQQQKIEMVPGKEAVSFQGQNEVEQVILDDGSKIKAGLVIVGKGVLPNKELLAEAGGETERGILVNNFLQTSLENIYAAGDVAETTDLTRDEKRINAIWPCAVEQGRLAAENMTGLSRIYSGSMSMNSLQFFTIPVISMGILSGNSEQYEEITFIQPDTNVYKKIVVRNKIVVGMIFVNSIDNAGVIGTLIRKGIDVTDVRERILYDDFSLAHIVPLVRKNKARFSEAEYQFLMKK